MTKRVMIKKFMKETGADKKTAMDYLRRSKWNYGNAISLYRAIRAIESIDVKKISNAINQTLQEMSDRLKEMVANLKTITDMKEGDEK